MGDRSDVGESATYARFRRMWVSAYQEADVNLANCESDHPFARCEQRMAVLCGMVDAGSMRAEVANERLIRLVVEANEIRKNEALRIIRVRLRATSPRRAGVVPSKVAVRGGDGVR